MLVTIQNQQLLDLNQELKQQLETVVEELNRFKRERQEKPLAKKLAQIENVYPSVTQ
jgi:hypothetical protein